MSGRVVAWCWCVAGLAAVPVAAQPAGHEPSLHFVRCAAERDAACLSVMTTLQPGEAARYAAADLRGDGARWTAALGTAELEGAAVTVPTHTSLPLRILVLVDLSGSMAGSGLEVTRSALRSFLFDVPDSVRVAIAPFQSRAVEPGIRDVKFVSRDSAFSLLTALPVPGGNTALYSAAAVGAERLAAEVAAAGPGAWGGLLLITDGANDVGNPGDDPGLLAGPEGRRIATETLGRSGIHAWLIGIGANVSAGELTALGGPGATSLLVGTDPLELARAFAAVQGWLFTERAFVFVLPAGGLTQLAGRESVFELRFRAGEGQPAEVVRTAAYRPPLFALPEIVRGSGVATLSQNQLASLPDAQTAFDRRWPMLLFFAALWLMLWVAVPRVLWPAEGAAAVAQTPHRAAPSAAAEEARTPGGGLRIDLEEAPPRSPVDVTGAFRAVR
jgi:hypothetical protein